MSTPETPGAPGRTSAGESCPQCGKPLPDEPRYCPSCGRRLDLTTRVGRLDGYAIASIVCAVAGLFALPLVGPILGIVFGHRAERNIAENPDLEGAGLAQAGVIVGWVGLIVSLVVIVLFLGAFASIFTSTSSGLDAPSRLIDPATWPAR